jgi:PKD repeat protein
MGQSQALLKPKQKLQFQYQVIVTAAQATTPKFTFAAGAPAAVVDWGDGTAQSAVTSGTELTHTYTAGGTYTVKLIAPNQANYLTQIDINADIVLFVLTPIQMFPALILFYGEVNSGTWTQNISCWVLPANLIQFRIDYNYTTTTANISSWVIPASLTVFYIDNSSKVSGVPSLNLMVSITNILVQDCGLPQASVDLWLSRCVAVEAQTTYATPTLNLGGSDAAPSVQGYTDKATLAADGWTVTTN